jgi:hypothetical protein
MRNISFTVLAFCAMATTSAMAADALGPTQGDCTTMAVQVRTALDANQSNSSYADAKKESNLGREFCSNSLPKAGVQHYAQALKLLGVSAS